MAQTPAQRALLLLAAACPDTPAEKLAQLSIGQRDLFLLTLREWCFGAQLISVATCPNCSERLELMFGVADVRAPAVPDSKEALALNVADYEVRFRLPNSFDLVALAEQKDLAADGIRLLERCLVTAHCNGEEKSAGQLPEAVVTAIMQRMSEADPQAEVQLKLSCPACGHLWQMIFDIVSFFWSEIEAWAYRMLREVHVLASAYGWREVDVLTMSPRRRQFYLEMVKA